MDRSTLMGAIMAAAIAAITSMALLVHRGVPVQAAPSGGIHRCYNTQLIMRPTNKGLGAALGHIGRWYRIRHLWGGPCSLQGFPRVELLDRNFHSLPIHVGRGGYIISATLPTREVVLDRQHDAYFALEYTDVRTCRFAPYLIVTPPNDNLPVVTYSGGLAPCPGDVGVSPVEPTPALH
jgi:hypothetical protein